MLILPVLLIPIIMDLSVFALIPEITASHGNTLMGLNVFISQVSVRKGLLGMELFVYQTTNAP